MAKRESKMTACPLGLAGQCYCANQVSAFAASGRPAKTAVLLLAHGSPENPDQSPRIFELCHRRTSPAASGDRRDPPPLFADRFLAAPLLDSLQADQLSQSLKMPVFVGMRNWKPFIADAVKEIALPEIRTRHCHLSRAAEFAHQRRPLPPRGQRRRKSSFQAGLRRASGTISRC